MISDNFLQLAIQTAMSSPSKKRVGAVLLKKNKIIATAVNLERKSHPIQARFAKRVGLWQKIYLHSEIHALIKAKEDADTIVVARINPQNKIRNAKPCPICSLALEEAGVKNIYYSTDDGFMYNYPSELSWSDNNDLRRTLQAHH
jgi:tRNA(Arg) A34 adenosine deaminase TadA